MVKDIVAGWQSSSPKNLMKYRDTLYFQAAGQIWTSDGTEAGTVRMDAAAGYSYVNNLTNVNGTLFFSANSSPYGEELWKSDGTAAGTSMVKDLLPGKSTDGKHGNFLAASGRLFYTTNDGTSGARAVHERWDGRWNAPGKGHQAGRGLLATA